MINLNKLTPKQAAKVINGTPFGKVIDVDQIAEDARKAGDRIAADAKGKSISLLKYLALLMDRRDRNAEPKPPPLEGWTRTRQISRIAISTTAT